jgi:hypothetical protein
MTRIKIISNVLRSSILTLSLAALAACAADDTLADDTLADDVASGSADLTIVRSPANLYALQQCGFFYGLAGWAYMENVLYSNCMPSSPLGHCLQSYTPYVYDLHRAAEYLVGPMQTAYAACMQAQFNGGFGACPAPGTVATASRTSWFTGQYDEVDPRTGGHTTIHYNWLGRAVQPPYTASYWEAVEAFFADSDTCYRAAGM